MLRLKEKKKRKEEKIRKLYYNCPKLKVHYFDSFESELAITVFLFDSKLNPFNQINRLKLTNTELYLEVRFSHMYYT